MSQDLLSAIEINPEGTASASLIWLHGLGADGNDFVPMIPGLELPKTLGLRFIFPHAPYRPVTINGGYVMRAWYDITSTSFTANEDSTGINSSAQEIQRLIQREIDSGIASQKIIIAGFSQGGAIALHTALRYPLPLAGVIALSTYLPLASSAASERQSTNNHIPIFMGHGSEDDIVPLPLGEASRNLLQEMDYPLEWHRYPMAHSVCPEEISDISRWLVKTLGQQ